MGRTKRDKAADPGAALLEVLEEENSIYGELLAISEAEYQAIVSARIDELTELLISKERLLTRAETLEQERQDQVRDIVGSAAAESARLEDIASRLEGAERERLLTVRDSLRENIGRLSTANQRNGLILRAGLRLIGKWVNLLASYAAASLTYAQDGRSASPPGRSVLDRQA